MNYKKAIMRIKRLMHYLAGSRYIIFESAPDLSDNSKYVFDEMLRRGLNKKYVFLWILFDGEKKEIPKGKNVRYVNYNKFTFRLYKTAAKCLISCNRFGMMTDFCDKGQFSIYLDHGEPLKDISRVEIPFPENLDFCLSNSEGLKKIKMRLMGISNPERVIPFGFPRNDEFFEAAINLNKLFDVSFDRIIVWYPTFRQHKSGARNESSFALPIIHDEDSAIELNEYAKSRRVLIVLKPHFAQDVSYIKDLGLSNIRFIDDAFFKANKITSYSFLNSTDALLTDYSSVYFDYTLHDKPIGLIWEDIEEYKSRVGLVKEYEELTKGGVKIYNLDGLKQFVDDIACDADRLQKIRRENRDFVNYALDGGNTKRVVDFIVEKAGLL